MTTMQRTSALVVAAVAMFVAVLLVIEPERGPGIPDGDGSLEVTIEQYAFEPATLRLPAGKPLSVTFVNRDDNVHELSFGRELVEGDLGPVAFGEDLLAGVDLRVDPHRALFEPNEKRSHRMVSVDPNETVTVEFTLPEDRVGEWGFGCFTAGGCHYRVGLHGTVIVE